MCGREMVLCLMVWRLQKLCSLYHQQQSDYVEPMCTF